MFKAMKLSDEPEESYKVSVVDTITDEVVHDTFEKKYNFDALEPSLLFEEFDEDDEEISECSNALNARPKFLNSHKQVELLNLPTEVRPHSKPSIEEPSMLELKPLPPYLKYAYLGESSTLLVIISSLLSKEQEETLLLLVLRENKRASGWTIVHIKGISPSICVHKIQLEEGHTPTIEHQRRLNPIMKEVVKKDIIKWLDAGIIYPIYDSS